MQVDRMCRAETEITIKQNKNDRVIVHELYNSAKSVIRKHSFNSSVINGRTKEYKKKRNCRHADGERRKKMNI